MRLNLLHVLIIIIIIIIIAIASFTYLKTDKLNINLPNFNKINSSTNYIPSITPSPTIDNNSSLRIPSNDYVINHINWSNYPYLQQGYVRDARISEPNDADLKYNITSKYIDVEIYIEIKNDDQSEVVNEMKGVAREARSIYGLNSQIFIIANKNGVFYNNVNTYPYEDTIYGGSLY
jgi:hypothetical protein